MGKAVIVFIVALALIYAVFWIRAGRPRPGRPRPTPPTPRKAVGPDDDPDFLRGLNRPQHREETDEDAPGS